MKGARTIIFLASFLSITPSVVFAEGGYRNGDLLLALRNERESSVGGAIRSHYSAAPATLHLIDSISISGAAVTADIERFDQPIVMQAGSGHNDYSLSAESYYKLSPTSTITGRAAYSNGSIRSVTFSDAVDYATVAPFVIGDDTGGKFNRQQYSFGGGWGHTFDAWALGIEADYSAAIAYRAIDPRVKNTVSDLGVRIGGGRTIGSSYMLGISAGIRTYNQDIDVDFYNPTTHAITYVFTGLGSVSNRFKGADTQTASHSLIGFNAVIQLVPLTKSNRFYATLSGDFSTVNLILHGYRDLSFGSTATKKANLCVSRLFSVNRLTVLPTVSAALSKRTATENLFGSSDENYLKIGERKNYYHNCYRVAVSIPGTLSLSQRTLMSASLHGEYLHDNEYLPQPSRSLKTDCVLLGVTIGATQRFGRHWTGGANIGMDSRNILSTSAAWGGLDLTTPEGEMTLSNYRMRSCDATMLTAGLSLSRAINSVAVTLSATYHHSNFSDINSGDRIVSALSLTF